MKKENVTYKWTFEEDGEVEVVYDKEQIIRLSKDIAVRADTDSGITIEKIAETSKGEIVYIEELFHLYLDEKISKSFDVGEIPNLSAVGLLTKLANMTLGREG
ncbi:hypothetical protein OK414_02000 [Priestia sp. JV24]|uniref:hypothetical protein n=1 Tax=Priestia TaxID=2800373 RepID=UPI0021D654C5|nr:MULTISPECIES: hypothetical protein [Priestia]MCU7712614.1 hypothetical protein [Priestia megaterium]MCW1043818.1 hypothetical protein [Priestia sp. JV24]